MIGALTLGQLLAMHKERICQGDLIADRATALDGAIMAPWQTVGGADAYPTLIGKVGKHIEAVTRVHAFTDGNKRLAWLSGVTILTANGIHLARNPNVEVDAANQVLLIASGQLPDGRMALWLADHLA